MKRGDLKVGTLYRLTQDVQNPVVDRRSGDKFLKLTVFREGMLIVCLAAGERPNVWRLHSTEIGLSGRNSCPGFTAAVNREGDIHPSRYERDQKWADAILPHLEEVPLESWELLRRAYGWHAESTVLRELVQEGAVSFERVVELMRKHTMGVGATEGMARTP